MSHRVIWVREREFWGLIVTRLESPLLTFAGDQSFLQCCLQRTVAMQESMVQGDGDVGSSVDGLRGGGVGTQLFSCDLPIHLKGGKPNQCTSVFSLGLCVLSPACPHPRTVQKCLSQMAQRGGPGWGQRRAG